MLEVHTGPRTSRCVRLFYENYHTCAFRNLGLTKGLQADDYYFSFFLSFSTCKVKIMWYILSHKDIELYLKVVFQVPGLLKNVKYIKVHIIIAILWFQQCVSLNFFFT